MTTRKISAFLVAIFLSCAAFHARADTFGTVVPLGGQASDIALDEPRGVLYVANFTANRIDLVSLWDYSFRRSINVAPQPGSLALSPDGRFLVIVHFGNFAPPAASDNALTVIDLTDYSRQTFALKFPPLGVAFGDDGLALIVTTNDFQIFDPVAGSLQQLDTITGLAARTLPVPLDTFPPQIVAASLGVSGDRQMIYGLTDTIRFSYNIRTHSLLGFGYQASPILGPRVVSVSQDGSYHAAGWAVYGCGVSGAGGCSAGGPLVAEFSGPTGALNIGSHAIDSNSGTIYAQVPKATGEAPVLTIADADNLTVRERLQLPENLAGKSVMNSAKDTMYSISDSGVMVLPVGSLNQAHRVTATQEDIIFRGSFCDQRVTTQLLTIVDPSGGNTPFTVSSATTGILVSPNSGITPAQVTVSIDPNVFGKQNGTVAGSIQIASTSAVNLPAPVRVLINNREPDQRGTIVDVPGTLVDLLSDPGRDRFYVLRQDKNQVLVFDASSNTQIATLRTGTTPTQMAITPDRQYLFVGHNDTQLAYAYDLDALQWVGQIVMPSGHYPKSIAIAGGTMLLASRVAGPTHTIDRFDFNGGPAYTPKTLGIFLNSVNLNTVLVASPNGSSIMAAMSDGNVMLYNASADTFTVSRKDTASLSGAYAASNYDQFVVGNTMFNSSLVAAKQFDTAAGAPISSGFAFTDRMAYRTTAAGAPAGVIQRMNFSNGILSPSTRISESPLVNAAGFTRTLAPLSNGNAMISLTTSGFIVLPWVYDAAAIPPRIDKLVNSADLTLPVASGGLISLFGANLSSVSGAAGQIPVPTSLGESCLTVNGTLVPMLYASPGQINAQLPFNMSGNATLVMRTAGGKSDNMNFTIRATAPSVFRDPSGTATVYRDEDNKLITDSTPIHLNDYLTIYLTGMGATTPAINAGDASPSNPLAVAQVKPVLTLGGASIWTLWAGLAPGQVGVYQINALVPFHHMPTGSNIPLTISQGDYTTTVPVRVVE